MPNIVEILVTAKNLTAPAFESATAEAKGLSGTMGKMALVGTAALGAIAVESVKMAAEFQSSTQRLVTSAGESEQNIDMVRKGMLDMAGQVGVSAEELAKSMYYVESAGFHGADGLTALKAAAQGAKAEGADVTTVVQAMTDVLTDYHLKASESANVTSQMITAVAHGKVSLQNFSAAFASIVPAASAAGISFADVAAALATMTNHGFTAQRASQNLAQALRSLLNPTAVMKMHWDQLGVSQDVVKQKLAGPNGLTDAMEYLSSIAAKQGAQGTTAYAAALKLLMGTAPGANAALSTVGESYKQTADAIDAISHSTADASGNVKGFSEIQGTLGQQTAELNANFQSLMIELGNELIPILTKATSWMTKHEGAVTKVAAGLLVLVAAMTTYVAVAKTAAAVTKVWTFVVETLDFMLSANPIGLVIYAIAALVVGIVIAYKKSETFRDVVNLVFKSVADVVLSAVHGILTAFEAFFNVLGHLPGKAGAAFRAAADEAGKARDQVDGLRASIDKLPTHKSVGITVTTSYYQRGKQPGTFGNGLGVLKASGGVVGRAASGGARNGLTMVGEHGPELLDLAPGTSVRSNEDSRRLASQGGSSAVIQLEWVGGNAGDEFMTWLRKNIRARTGGNVQKALGS